MSLQLLSQQYCAIKLETVRNTAEIVPNIVLKISADDVQLVKETELDEIVRGNRDNNYDERFTKRTVEGKLTGKINNKDIGQFLRLAMGGYSTPVTTLGATTHTFRPLNLVNGIPTVALPSFTLFHARGADGHFKARGCVIDELAITFGESESTFEASIKGLDEVKITNSGEITNILSSISYVPPDLKFNFGNIVVRHADTVAGLTAGTVLNVKPDVKLTIKNNVEYDMSSGANPNAELTNFDTYARKFEASLELSALVRTSTAVIREAFLAGGKKSFQIDLQNQSGGVIGTSTLFRTLRFTIPSALIKSEYDLSLNEAIAMNINLENLINDVAVGYSFEVALINDVATY